MNIPQIIPAEPDGYCEPETGQCVTTDPATADGSTEPEGPPAATD
jgi:hypothetical protein